MAEGQDMLRSSLLAGFHFEVARTDMYGQWKPTIAEFNIQLCEEEPKEEGEAEPLRDGAVFALYLAKSCKKT